MKLLILTDLHRGFSNKTADIHKKLADELSTKEWDILLLCGDTASHKKEQFRDSLEFWREVAGERPILLVRGNHDLWDANQRSLTSLMDGLHKDWFKEYNIHHLEESPYVLDNIMFVGWDGWYKHNLPTNNLNFMNNYTEGNTWHYLQKRSYTKFCQVLESAKATTTDKVIAVSHFPILKYNLHGGDEFYWNEIKDYIDVFIYGHTHKYQNEIIDNVLVLNAGSDYDNPKYIIQEI